MVSLLTFGYLRELQKKERESRKLERVQPDFYQALSEYVARKNKGDDAGLVDKKEFESAVPVIKYILDRREQKILEFAMAFVRAGVKPENLHPVEEELFDGVCRVLAKRKALTDEVFGVRPPEKKDEIGPGNEEESGNPGNEPQPGGGDTQANEKQEDPAVQCVRLRLLKEVPAFIAEDMKSYGPWVRETVAECPPKAAAILVENGFAEYG